MSDRICVVPNCSGRQKGQGYCPNHYAKFRRYGDPLGRKMTAIERYESYTDRLTTPDGCHPWISNLSPSGYGKFYSQGKHWRSHRFGWTLYVGPIPDGLVIRHKVCDNPPCQNIQHLAIGTTQDNTDDAVASWPRRFGVEFNRGESNPNAKLTRQAVDEIRAKYARGQVTYSALAAEFNVSHASVWLVVANRIWT